MSSQSIAITVPLSSNLVTLPNGEVIDLMNQWGYLCEVTGNWIMPGIGTRTREGLFIPVEDEEEAWNNFDDEVWPYNG